MKNLPLAASEALAVLRANAASLWKLTGGVPPVLLYTAPQPAEWSPNDSLAHVRACGDVWGGNITRILAAERPTFAGTSPRTWMDRTDYPVWRFEDAFRAFAAQREALLNTLDALAPDDWERTATVTSYGQAHERTLRSYASKLAKHERTHVHQIRRTLGQTSVS